MHLDFLLPIIKSNQRHKISKSSARQFSTGRFSATRGFDTSASQAADSSVEVVVTDYLESGVISTALTTEEQEHEQNEQVEAEDLEEELEENIEEFISDSLPEESAISL
ncbi:hypothetical protein A0J61_04499 [Choanephora cucurbitarum]|uniref:Uncharacterized protein n=1 Tax=Choanephora cucurbitarum TaxID=101091 RepID=A0A1C7NED4_9FUNG|nr:hypothetical protein A0J61_04499 [Choanephora cucurbitarum]